MRRLKKMFDRLKKSLTLRCLKKKFESLKDAPFECCAFEGFEASPLERSNPQTLKHFKQSNNQTIEYHIK
jgi:hypothetical protein